MQYDWSGLHTQRVWRLKLAALTVVPTILTVILVWTYL
jgi:hypothetical protein